MIEATFRLTDNFIEKYKSIKPPFGFNGLGEFVYLRTYSRLLPDGTNEVWHQTIRRVVEGCYRMQERHIKANDLGWSNSRAQKSAQEMYDRMFWMKFLPPGRGLWAMGSKLTESEKPVFSALFNCAFVSSENIAKEQTKPFCFLMDISMLGVGVGFDVNGAGAFELQSPGDILKNPDTKSIIKQIYPDLKDTGNFYDYTNNIVCYTYNLRNYHNEFTDLLDYKFIIPDTREGWVLSIAYLLNAFFTGDLLPKFDYSQIRPAGLPIKGFGGLSSGHEPLKYIHEKITELLTRDIGKSISVENITDICNLIACCVVAGNVRRSALLALGNPNDINYLKLKDYKWNSIEGRYIGSKSERAEWGWTSNNTVSAKLGMDYTETGDQTGLNGEPGYILLENVQDYSRLCDPKDYKDKKAKGTNPCGEQSLEHMELCNLVESFPYNCKDLNDYLRTLKFAYLYAKTVTLAKTHWRETNKITLKNRRIGCSMSGIQQFIAKNGIHEFKDWCQQGYATVQYYDKLYSDWMCIPQSIKLTSVKPSGTVSIVAGSTPGMHWPESTIYIRRVRVAKNSKLLQPLIDAGYHTEEAVGDSYTMVISFPVKLGESNLRTTKEVSMWEQLEMAAFLQAEWSDNMVSSTISFNPETEGHQIKHALDMYQYRLKGISFLPKLAAGAYAQMPYEEIDEAIYSSMIASIKPINFGGIIQEVTQPERFCDSDKCMI